MADLPGIEPRRRATITIIAIIVVVGLLMVGLWAAALASITAARNTAIDHARQEAQNLAAAVADEVAHTLDGIAAGIDVVARRMRNEPPPYDINDWARKIPVLSFGTIQGAIIGPDGRLISTTLDPHPQPVDLSDREHFRIHLDGQYKGIFIGQTVLGRVSHQTTIQITRRVESSDGTFLGVILFSVAPASLTSLTTSIDLGAGGVIALAGLDNVVRARFTRDHPDGLASVGQSIVGDPRPAVFPEGASGSYIRSGVVDHVARVLSYRRIGTYPLVATVGLDLNDVLAAARQYTRVVGVIGGVTTVVVAALIGFLIREIRRRATNETALAEEHAKLDRVQQIAGIGSIEVNVVTGFVKWSPGACAIFGIAGDAVEPTIDYILGFVHPDDKEAVLEGAGRSRALGVAAAPLEYRIIRPDGAVRNVYREYDMQFDAEGHPILRIMTFKDVTEIKATEAQLLEAQRMGKIGHWLGDDVTQTVTWSPQMFEIAGLPPGSDIPMNIPGKVIHPDDLVKYLEARARAIETRTASMVELRWVRPDGEIRWVHLNINPRFDSSERCVGLFGTTQDITDVKAKEVQLRSVIDQLDRVQRIAGIGHTTEDLSTGQYIWSPGAAAIFGVDPASTEPTPEYMRQFYHPEDRAKIIEAAEDARARGIPALPLEYRIVRPDGAVRTVYRENAVETDASGHPVRRIVTFKDITETKAAEARLRQTTEHLDRVQRIAGIGSVEQDIATGRLKLSPIARAIFGVERDEGESEDLTRLFHPDDRAFVLEAGARARASGVAGPPLEYRIVRPDGAVRTLYRESETEFNPVGSPIRRIMTFKDITEIKAAETRLRQTTEHLDRVQRIAGIGSIEQDIATRRLKLSSIACAIFGVERDEGEDEDITRLFHPDDRAFVLEAAAQARASGVAGPPLEYRIVRPDGRVRTLYRESETEFDPDGRPIRRIMTIKDITDIKAAETRLRRTLDHLDRVQKIAGIGSTTMDLATGFFEWSLGACAIFGIDDRDVEPNVEFFRRFVHPEDAARVKEAAARAAAQSTRAPPLEYRIIRPDGAVRTVYRENDVELDAAGRAIRRIVTFKDVTEIKETEMRLRQTLDILARAQRLSHTGSDFRDLRSGALEWSAETYRIFGVDPNSFKLTTENFISMVIPEDRPKVFATRDQIVRGENPAPFEYRIRRPSGEIRCIYRITEVIWDDIGAPIQVAGTIHDVTELREAEKRQKDLERQLLHSQKLEAVGTLAGGIAHELNNALVPILALGRMILDGLPPASEMREDIEIMVLASQRAKDLVQGILAFSRKGEASRREVDPVQLIRQTLSVLRATLPATLQICEEIAPVPPLIADADALQQVVVNMVTNAAHAIGNALGTITVAVEAAKPEQTPSHHTGKEFVRIRIADTGCGMDAMTVQRIFEPFFTTKNVGEGTGLGLSVVHGIIADHGGQINVASEPGKGTEFSIYLPSLAATVPLLEAVA